MHDFALTVTAGSGTFHPRSTFTVHPEEHFQDTGLRVRGFAHGWGPEIGDSVRSGVTWEANRVILLYRSHRGFRHSCQYTQTPDALRWPLEIGNDWRTATACHGAEGGEASVNISVEGHGSHTVAGEALEVYTIREVHTRTKDGARSVEEIVLLFSPAYRIPVRMETSVELPDGTRYTTVEEILNLQPR